MLSDAERAVLYAFCMPHPVARCPNCHEDLSPAHLGADLIGSTRDFCPVCRADLTEPLRWHIVTCDRIAAAVGDAVEHSRLLRKVSEAERSRSEILIAVSDALAQSALQSRQR